MRRNKHDIMADMLVLAKAGVRKTRLVYGANLNFSIVNKYLKKLTDENMMHEMDGTYFTTPKGEVYLTNYRTLLTSFGPDPTPNLTA